MAVVELPIGVKTACLACVGFVLPEAAVIGELHHLTGTGEGMRSGGLRVLRFSVFVQGDV